MRARLILDVLNFALAGAREGFGPFLGVFLQARGFDPAMTGIVMSLAGVSGLVATTPIGALIDRTERKRLALILAVAAIAFGAVVIVVAHRLWLLGVGQVLIGFGDTAIAPLVAAITLGVVGAEAFGARTARNEAFNHAGNAANAAFAAILGYAFGLGYVALAIVVMAALSSLTVAGLAPGAIDHVAARSGEQDERSTIRALLATPGLLPLAAAVMLFQTANGAMLPFLAQARTAAGGNASLTTGVMIVVARLAMASVALYVPRLAARRTYAGVLTFALATVMVRGALAFFATTWAVVVPVQILEGVSMGLAGVAIPALNAAVMAGTGRVSAGLGVTLTAYGIGGTLSPLVAGFAAQRLGFFASFPALGAIAGLGLLGWTLARRRVGAGPLGDDARGCRMTAAPAPAGRPAVWSAVVGSSFPALVLVYLALFGAFGTESPFFPSFLGQRGLAASEIGVVLSVGTVVRLVTGPLQGMAADVYGARRVLALATLGAGGFILLYLLVAGFWPLLLVCMIHSVAIASINPLADALAIAAAARERVFSYGWVRGVGSAGFILGTLASGPIVARYGLSGTIVAASILFVLMVVPIPRLPRSVPAPPAVVRGAVPTLLAIPRFRHMLIVAGLIIGSHAMSDAFAVIHWRHAGIGSTAIGLLWSTAVAAEILVFVLVGPPLLRRLGPSRCMALAATAGILRWSVLAQTTLVAALAATQLLHGLTFALLHLACMQIIGDGVPEKLSATAQTLYGTLCLGIASAALTLLSGALYGALGAKAFWSMTLLCVVALPIALALPARPATSP